MGTIKKAAKDEQAAEDVKPKRKGAINGISDHMTSSFEM